MILSIILSTLLIILGLIHFNWVLGGTFGYNQSLPTKENGARIFNPRKIDSAIVGIGLTLFSLFYLIKAGYFGIHFPDWLIKFGGWVIPIIFILRAIGDFRYVGIFKTIQSTNFGKLDTKLFSPLSLLIGISGIIIQLGIF